MKATSSQRRALPVRLRRTQPRIVLVRPAAAHGGSYFGRWPILVARTQEDVFEQLVRFTLSPAYDAMKQRVQMLLTDPADHEANQSRPTLKSKFG